MTGPDAVDLGFARVDVGREARQGLPEVIYGTGKTAAEIASIARTLLRHNDGPVLATRVDAEVAAAVLAAVGDGAVGGALEAGAAGPGVAGTPVAGGVGSGLVGTWASAGAAVGSGVAGSRVAGAGVGSGLDGTWASAGAAVAISADPGEELALPAGVDVRSAAAIPAGTYDDQARLLVWRPAAPIGFTVVVAAAGTADQPVAREAAAIATAVGITVTTITDVGVAGLHRLLAEQDRLRAADTVIVVAGMEGALASAIGGLVACPVVAVPTSTGYGAGLEGITALLAMHASCAAGITVVNIDSGFGAAMAAFRLSRIAHRSTS